MRLVQLGKPLKQCMPTHPIANRDRFSILMTVLGTFLQLVFLCLHSDSRAVFDDGELRQDPERARQEVDDMIRTMDSPNPAEASPPASDLVEVFRTTWLRLAKVKFLKSQRCHLDVVRI